MAETLEKEEEVKDEVVETTDSNEVDFEIELDDEAVSEVEKSVLEANKGKAKDELADEIEAAKKEKLESIREESKPLFDKIKELSEKEENKDKTPEELQAMATEALSEGSEEGGDEGDKPKSILDDPDFVGTGKREKKEVETETETVIPEDVKAELEEYRALKGDKTFSAFMEAKKSGNASDFDEMYRKSGLHIDPKTLPAGLLYENSLKELGVKGEELEEAMETFNELKTYEKAEKVAPLRARLEQEIKVAREQFFGSMTEKVASTKVDTATEVSSIQDELKGNYLGKRFFGVDIDEKVVDRLVSNYRKGGIRVTTPDGKLDVAKTVEAQLVTENLYEIIDAAVKRSSKETSRKEQVKRGKPSLGFKVKGVTPRPKIDPKEALNRAIEMKYGKK